MKKEILTRENCKIDLLETTKGRTGPWIYLTAALGFLFVMGEILVWLIMDSAANLPGWCFPAVTVLFAILPGLTAFGLIHRVRKNKEQRRMIENGHFRIVQDVLTRSAQDVDGVRFDRDSYRHRRFGGDSGRNRLCLLEFGTCGKFYILHYNYYKWSKRYFMSAEGIFNTSLVGDSFYLVFFDGDKKNEPVMVYNAKYFELQEEEDRYAW